MNDRLKERALAKIDSMRDEFIRISTVIHSNPELGFQEFKSANLLCDMLQTHDFIVERGIAGVETAFRAEAKGCAPGSTIAILAEYDALPEIGHACGHNIIATSALAASIAVRSVIDQLPGRLLMIGTPGEEGGGGKIILLDHGAFDHVDVAMLVHPSCSTIVDGHSLASTRLKVEFYGKASHAAAAPEDGINALEAVILTFNNVNALRLHLKSDVRVHGIIQHGGTMANVIPEYASAIFSVRAHTKQAAEETMQRVLHCAQAAATATDAQLTYTIKPGYAEMIPNQTLAHVFADNWRAINVAVGDRLESAGMASTDMGNVSHAIPSIQPYIAIAPEGTPGHTIQFRQAAISPAGHAGMIDAAKGMALTTIDLLCQPELVARVKHELNDRHFDFVPTLAR